MELDYITRDAKGCEVKKVVKTKEYIATPADFDCPICHIRHSEGIRIKDIVSSNFTDWAYVSNFVCKNCAALFSLYFYSYIISPQGVRLLNVRQLREELISSHQTPFKFIITTSQKKHLFYRSITNYTDNPFAVNLETETIYTTTDRMRDLFKFVENLQTLGQTKDQMKRGEIRFDVIKKVGYRVIGYLQNELQTSREIQIPLHCGQKLEITEEQAICNINSILAAQTTAQLR